MVIQAREFTDSGACLSCGTTDSPLLERQASHSWRCSAACFYGHRGPDGAQQHQHRTWGKHAGGALGDVQEQVQSEMMKAVSMGMGIYVSAFAAIYFAGIATKKFLAGRAA